MKSFVASICLRTFICNRSFGVIEDEDKSFLFTQSTSPYTFTNFGQMIGWANIRKIYKFGPNSTLYDLITNPSNAWE